MERLFQEGTVPTDDTQRLDLVPDPYAQAVLVDRRRQAGYRDYPDPPGKAAVPLMTAVVGLLLGLLLGYQIPREAASAPPQDDAATAIAERDARIATLEQELIHVNADREAAAAAQDAALDARRIALDEREAALAERERALSEGIPPSPPPIEEERGLLDEAADRLRTFLD